jgi:hypothetical protein
MPQRDPFHLTAAEIQRLIIPGAACVPELETARRDLDELRLAPQTQAVLAQTEPYMDALEHIPFPTYTHYRSFIRKGDRRDFETPYFARRSKLSAAAIRLFLGQSALKDIVQDYLWAICEETNWVLPAHENVEIDLFSAETGFMLADMLNLLGDTLDAEVRSRVRTEIERRIFDRYLRFCRLYWWYQGPNNWNGVCNSSIAATFLLLESEPGRVARALELALAGLQVFLATAFEQDGSSTEGVAYWHYGLINLVSLSEMLRARTNGAIDLLDSERIRKIAAYPAKMLLSASRFATFSDCDEVLNFDPGIIARLMERTGEPSLVNLLTPPIPAGRDWRLAMWLRDILWWDGQYHKIDPLNDAYLPAGGVARLVAQSPGGAPVVLAIKAGHNAENHNQNDVGSFLLHVDGETFLTDPGRGLYTRQYFGPERYDNIFANSYGHSVPRIGGQLQKEGREYCGEMVSVGTSGPVKRAEVELARAYAVPNLASLRRQVTLSAEGEHAGTVWLQDTFRFSQTPARAQATEVEEALLTWLDVDSDGATALLRGERHTVRLTIEAPTTARLHVERLEEQCRANDKPGVLKRITCALPAAAEVLVRVRIEVI